jgi:hypothetical protein
MDLAQHYPEAFRRVVERAWADEKFKSLLVSDPVAAAEREGIPVPYAVKQASLLFRVVADIGGQ